MFIQKKIRVLSNVKVKEDCFKLSLKSAILSKKSAPGQFVHIRLGNKSNPLLRRPFSIHRVKNQNCIEILYKVVGQGTEILSKKCPGEYLDIIGPLGRGFNFPLHIAHDTLHILVAGGMGIAPLVFLAQRLREQNTKQIKRKITVIIGAKTAGAIFCVDELKKLLCEVKIATDDGSRGFKGSACACLDKLLSTIPSRNIGASHRHFGGNYQSSTVYACGPWDMLKEINRCTHKRDITAEVSLENFMGCGIGACLGCAIKTKSQKGQSSSAYRYSCVCKDGPVFPASEIVWN